MGLASVPLISCPRLPQKVNDLSLHCRHVAVHLSRTYPTRMLRVPKYRKAFLIPGPVIRAMFQEKMRDTRIPVFTGFH